MLAKILTLLAILAAIYILFFKFGRSSEIKNENKKIKKDKKAESFVECSKCGTFVELDEAILNNGKYICKECI